VRVVRSDTQLSPSCAVQEDPVPVGAADITVRAVLLLVLPEHCALVPKHVAVIFNVRAVCNDTVCTGWYT
jgi:hypothetical protein